MEGYGANTATLGNPGAGVATQDGTATRIQLDRLEKALGRLREQSAAFTERLHPVMMPQQPVPSMMKGDTAPQVPRSPFSVTIGALADTAELVGGEFAAILSVVDL